MTKQQTKQKWSTVVDVSLHFDRNEGIFMLEVHNANEDQVAVQPINAVKERAAMMEATAWMDQMDYAPAARYWSAAEEEGVSFRKFRRMTDS